MAIPLKHLERDYEILEKIRDTGLGAIYRVRHRSSGELRAAQVLRPKLQDDPGLRLRFDAEAHAASRLGHPNVARIFDASIDDEGAAYVVTELVPGTTMAELLATSSPVPLALALEVARQGLAALGHLHRHGVALRDLSPAHLMLSHDEEGRPMIKLIDSGLVSDAEGDRSPSAFLGTIRYAAPETFDRQIPDDPRRSDLYAFAVVLYELLTGRFPIAGDNESALIAGHLFRPPVEFSESDPEGKVPEPVRRAVLKALAKSPADRFADAESFAAALGSSTSAPAPAAAEPATVRLEDHETLRVLHAGAERAGEPGAGNAGATMGAAPSRDLDATLRTIRALRDDGRTGEAFERLNLAVRQFGPEPTLRTLRDELGEALLERDAAEGSRRLEPRSAQAPAARPAAPPLAEAPIRDLSDAPIRGVAAPARADSDRPEPPAAHPTRGMVAVGLILSAVFAVLVYLLTREDGAGRQHPVEVAAVPESAPGSLALDAVPWAEIVALENPAVDEEVPISPSRFTPVILSLPPGEYRITLRYPPTGQAEERIVHVDSDVRTFERVAFENLDAEQYFERAGW